MSDHDDDKIPDVKVCEDLCQSFAAITDTDTACAQCYLQDREWDLSRSLNAFFEDQAKSSGSAQRKLSITNAVVGKDSASSFAAVTAFTKGASTTTTSNVAAQQRTFKFISWNIDGLDEKNITKRTKSVCDLLNSELPDVVHLQEVIWSTFNTIEQHLPKYKCIAGDSFENDYFTATLLLKATMTYEKHSSFKFPGSLMLRGLLTVDASFGSIPFSFLNSHLESCAEHSKERTFQLQQSFRKVLAIDPTRTVIFGGDLNLRDKEIGSGPPAGIEDMWAICGSRPECRFTWDCVRNSNINFDGSQRFKPRCRFDRIYLRQSNPSHLTPKYFGLVGLEKVPSCQCFPSDHWGLVTIFEK